MQPIKPATTTNSMSSTMPIPMEEIYGPDAEMHLYIRSGGGLQPAAVKLEQKSYTIGRQDQIDIPIMISSVSRRHARLFHLHGEEIIEDLNSTNGVLVNGVRVARCVLQHNDVIRLGDATLLFTRMSTNTANEGSVDDEN